MTNERNLLALALPFLEDQCATRVEGLRRKDLIAHIREFLQSADEPTPGRCPTCSRWLEMRCAVCGPVESSDEPNDNQAGTASSHAGHFAPVASGSLPNTLADDPLGDGVPLDKRQHVNRRAPR